MHLTLFVPDLIWPEPGDTHTYTHLHKLLAQRSQALPWLLARAQWRREPNPSHEESLASQFGVTEGSLASWRYRGEHHEAKPIPSSPPSSWRCADPVHLRFHQERLVLADATETELSTEEACRLVTDLNQMFPDVGHFHLVTPERWYLELSDASRELKTQQTPLSQVVGRQLHPDTDSNPRCLRLVHELQMFLHMHPVNEARRARGSAEINSLWLWGDPQLFAPPTTKHHVAPRPSLIYAEDPLTLGLAYTVSNNRVERRCPQNLQALLEDVNKHPQKSGNTWVTLTALHKPALYQQGDHWASHMAILEEQWFQPAQAALGKSLSSLRLLAPTIYGMLEYQLSPRSRWHFWRRERSLQQWAEYLAESAPQTEGQP